jgi:NADH-quinone oxidoreductase subunit L
MKGWGIVGIAMLVGCLNLAGFPFTAGYFSKDMILAEAFVTPGPGYADRLDPAPDRGLTAYYTFRVFFRVFIGPRPTSPATRATTTSTPPTGHGHDDHFHPHAPGWAINAVLVTLTVLSLLASGLYFVGADKGLHTKHYAATMITSSSASYHTPTASTPSTATTRRPTPASAPAA